MPAMSISFFCSQLLSVEVGEELVASTIVGHKARGYREEPESESVRYPKSPSSECAFLYAHCDDGLFSFICSLQ